MHHVIIDSVVYNIQRHFTLFGVMLSIQHHISLVSFIKNNKHRELGPSCNTCQLHVTHFNSIQTFQHHINLSASCFPSSLNSCQNHARSTCQRHGKPFSITYRKLAFPGNICKCRYTYCIKVSNNVYHVQLQSSLHAINLPYMSTSNTKSVKIFSALQCNDNAQIAIKKRALYCILHHLSISITKN